MTQLKRRPWWFLLPNAGLPGAPHAVRAPGFPGFLVGSVYRSLPLARHFDFNSKLSRRLGNASVARIASALKTRGLPEDEADALGLRPAGSYSVESVALRWVPSRDESLVIEQLEGYGARATKVEGG